MSDNYLRLFPLDPHHIPSEESAQAAIAVLEPALPQADEIVAESYGHPVFIDQGANFEAVICPACGARLPFSPDGDHEDVVEWWSAITAPLGQGDPTELEVSMICCGASVKFDSLLFDWPAGVASFEIKILNPGIAGDLPPDLLATIQRALGVPVKQVWAHY